MRASITNRLPTIGWGAVLVAFAGVPVVFSRSTADVFNIVKVTLLWLTVVVGLACWIGGCAARRRWTPMPLVAVPIAAFVGLTALATALSVSPVVSLVGQYRRYDGLLSLLAYVALALLVVAYTWEQPGRLRQLAQAGVAGAAGACAYIFIQQAGLDPWTWIDSRGLPLPHPQGTLGNSNFAGAYLALAVPMTIGLRATAVGAAARWAYLGVAAALAAGVWLAQSRGGFIALSCGVAACGLFDRRSVPRLVAWSAGLAGAGGLVLVLTFVVAGSVPVPGASGDSDDSVGDTSTLESRSRLWEGAVGVIAANPLVGTGPDTFLVAYPPHRPFDDGASVELAADEPHNILLDHAAGRGVPALVAYLAVIVMTFRLAWRGRNEVPSDVRPLLAAFAGVLVAYLVQGLVSIDSPPLAMAGWLAVAALASLTDPRLTAARQARAARVANARRSRTRKAPTPVERTTPLPALALGALGLGVAFASIVAVRPLVADARYRDGVELSNGKAPPGTTAAAFDAALTWNPWEPAYEVRRAQYWQQLGAAEGIDDDARRDFYGAAARHFDRALSLLPGNPFVLRDAARFRAAWAAYDDQQFSDADALYQEALGIDPYNWQLRDDYGTMLEAWAQSRGDVDRREQAIAQFERTVELRPEYADGWVKLTVLYEAEGDIPAAAGALERARRLSPSEGQLNALVDAFEERHPDVDVD